MIELRQKEEAVPLCPHCSEALAELWFRELKSSLGKRYVYFFSRCRNILGVSHRKGFWMG